jgi:hypothetical protein
MYKHSYKIIWSGKSDSIFTILNVPFPKSNDKKAIAFVKNHVLLRDFVLKQLIIQIIPL